MRSWTRSCSSSLRSTWQRCGVAAGRAGGVVWCGVGGCVVARRDWGRSAVQRFRPQRTAMRAPPKASAGWVLLLLLQRGVTSDIGAYLLPLLHDKEQR